METKQKQATKTNMTLSNRILILELFKERTEKEIAEIKKETKALEIGLKQINDTIKSVKNWIVGAVVMYLVQSVGLLEVLKKFI